MKKIFAVLLSCVILLSVFAVCSSAAEYSDRYTTIEINCKQ